MSQVVSRALISSLFFNFSMCGITQLLVSLLMELVKFRVNRASLEMSIFEKLDALWRQAPSSFVVSICFHKLAVLFGMVSHVYTVLVYSNREMGATDVVSSERSQISVDFLGMVHGVFVFFISDGNWSFCVTFDVDRVLVTVDFVFVLYAFGWVASGAVKLIFVTSLVVSKFTACICSMAKIALHGGPCGIFLLLTLSSRCANSLGTDNSKLSRVFTHTKVN